MTRHRRRTTAGSLIACSLFAGSLVAGHSVTLAPAAAAAPAVGTCTVKPAADGLSVTVRGSGWDPEADLRIDGGEGTGTVPVEDDGTFSLVRFQQSTAFTVLPATGGTRACQVLTADDARPETGGNALRKARQEGFSAGVKAGTQAARQGCGSAPEPPPKPGPTARNAAAAAAFEQGFLAGAQSAFDLFCR
ncbi:hypothetical protein [Streptomyces sp. NPDC058701]|uniref:hypothetical protein n=1 Tax=Streptomyces sp. NPDC058701 TaxID=3346608 RepID=UPI003655FC5C